MRRLTEIENAKSQSEIEEILNEAVKKHDNASLELSVGLNKIKKDYFKDDEESDKGKSFKEYLKTEAINLPYSTAQNYAKIGALLEEFKEEIEAIDYEVKNGLNKLKYVNEYASILCSDDEMDFSKIPEDEKRIFIKKALKEFKKCSFKEAKELSTKNETSSNETEIKITSRGVKINGEKEVMFKEAFEQLKEEIKKAILEGTEITGFKIKTRADDLREELEAMENKKAS